MCLLWERQHSIMFHPLLTPHKITPKQVLREMVSLAAPPSKELCNDLLRLQGKKNRIDGMFATLDVRVRRVCVCMLSAKVCAWLDTHRHTRAFNVFPPQHTHEHDRLTNHRPSLSQHKQQKQLMGEAGLHPDTDSYQHLGKQAKIKGGACSTDRSMNSFLYTSHLKPGTSFLPSTNTHM